MNFDPFEFYGGNEDFFNYGYGNGYDNGYGNVLGGAMQSFYWIIGLLIGAVVLGIIVNYTFLRRKNEGKFHGFPEKLYNLFSFNRFYSEGITKLLNVITFFVLTFMGIYMICTGGGVSGILVIVFGNLAARLCYELTMMFIIFCKKSVSMDKKLSAISKFYDDMEDWDYHDASDEGMEEDETKAEAVEEMEDTVDDVSAFEPDAAEFQEKLKAALGDPDAPKYGYDEECKTCDKWSEEEQDCYCPDDCLTCDKPDEDLKTEEAKEEIAETPDEAEGTGE